MALSIKRLSCTHVKGEKVASSGQAISHPGKRIVSWETLWGDIPLIVVGGLLLYAGHSGVEFDLAAYRSWTVPIFHREPL